MSYVLMLAALAAPSAPAPDFSVGIKQAEATSNAVMEQGFHCMDEQTKSYLLAHADATPELVVEEALQACDYLKGPYAAAVTSPGSYISAPKGKELADDWFASLRKAYLEHWDDAFLEPKFAEARTHVIVAQWRKCITDKAADWSRLQDEARTVGQAAVTACDEFRPKVEAVVKFGLRSQNLPASGASEVTGKVRDKMQDIATATVIAERAKRLPKH